MKTVHQKLVGALVSTVLAGAVSAHAVIIAVDLGTSAPPMVLGGYTMTPFGLDNRPLNSTVTYVASPLGGVVSFSRPLRHLRVGVSGPGGWDDWSHGYTGDVYATSEEDVTLTLPADTTAFYLYAEPKKGKHTITVTANDGTSLSVLVDEKHGANGYGFYLSGPGSLTTLTVAAFIPGKKDDFAIGEFGIAKWSGIPTPLPEGWSGLSSLWAFGLALASMGGLRLRRCRS